MPADFTFFPVSPGEQATAVHKGINPKHLDYSCGACGQSTNGRVIATTKRECDGATVTFCVCSCPKVEATVMVERGSVMISQLPEEREFQVGEDWPLDLSQLFEEASKAYSATAFTASAMVCRKILMACAVQEGDKDGKNFTDYVSYITDEVLTFPKAKSAIDKIRGIGNDANHRIRLVTRDDARRALSIVNYMLTTIYSLPAS